MLRAILFPLDASDFGPVATRYALDLAKKLEASLHALYVMDSRLINASYWTDYGAVSLPTARFTQEMTDLLRTQGETTLGRFREEAEGAGVPYRSDVRSGIPTTEILAASQEADLILMGRQGETGQLEESRGLGTVVERVLRQSSRPVLVTPKHFVDIRRVVLGFDGSERASETMRYAFELAERLKLPLLAVSVQSDSNVAQAHLTSVEHYAQAQNFTFSTHILSGDPVEAILSVVQPDDLIAIGAFGEGRIREFLLGSTTEAILRESGNPVLLHR